MKFLTFSLARITKKQRNNTCIVNKWIMHVNVFERLSLINQSINQSISHGWMMDGWFYNIFE